MTWEHRGAALQGGNLYKDFDYICEQRKAWTEGIKDKILSWEFNSFDLDFSTSGNPLIVVTMTVLESYGVLDDLPVDKRTLEKFLYTVEREYLPNSYHNAIHAADVTQTTAIMLESLEQHLHDITSMEKFCIIVAAAVHDLGHLGVNNDFLINSKHPRATIYNDKSVNENYHISRAFELARNAPGCDIFAGFDFQQQKKCRKLMIDVVMATDMAIHFDILKAFSAQLDAHPDLNVWTERNLLFQMVVHLADIANPSRPFPLARGWAERVIEEFCGQGDKEKSLGLPLSPFCIRDTMNMPKAQLGFIEIFLKPTLTSCTKAMPKFAEMALRHLDLTITEWRKLEAQGFRMHDTAMHPQHLRAGDAAFVRRQSAAATLSVTASASTSSARG